MAHMSETGMEQKYIQEAFDTKWVVPLGPNVDGFEEDLKGYLSSSKEVVALASGTAAVHLSLLAAGVGAVMRCSCRVLRSVLRLIPLSMSGRRR